MKTFLHKSILLFAAFCGMMPVKAAEAGSECINGYFRIQSAAGVENNTGYVQVRGPFTAAPDQSYSQAKYQAGTIMFVNGVPEMVNGKLCYKVVNLRSQGIEVVGEPIDDYFDVIVNQTDIDLNITGLYSLMRAGRDLGYTAIGRAMLQTAFLVVASRLDSELSTGTELEELARDFNENVAAKINLYTYLEPVEGAGGCYRMFFDMPDLQSVCDWYLQDEAHKISFEKGFAAMRHYLTGKGIGTGEAFDPQEIAEMKSYGYDITKKYAPGDDGIVMSSYEQIFADPDLLFNWLKLNMIKFLTPERCPQITIQGIYLPDMAKELRSHRLVDMVMNYFPRLHTSTRYYLISGSVTDASGVEGTAGDVYNATGEFGFANAAGTVTAGKASQWVLKPVNDTDNVFCVAPRATDGDKYYSAIYTDFPMRAVNRVNTEFHTMGETTFVEPLNGVDYHYVEIEQLAGDVPARTPVLVVCATNEPADNLIVPAFDTVLPGPADPTVPGFEISDDETAVQHSPARGVARATGVSPFFNGVLLATPINAESMKNMWGIEYDEAKNPVHRLTTYESGGVSSLWFENNTGTLNANEACIVTAPKPANKISVGMPTPDDIATGIETVGADGTAKPAEVYDLKGNRVDEMLPGRIYIIDGVKVFAH